MPLDGINVSLLASLRAAAEQHDQCVAVPPEVDPISGAGVDAVFQDARPDALHVGQNAPSHAIQHRCDFRCRLAIEAVEPSPERTATLGVDILGDLDHGTMVTSALP